MIKMTGIILAGGQSRRMGFNKAFIKFGGESIIHRTAGLFKELFEEVILVANQPVEYEDLDLFTVTDIIKGAGSLGGIYTGLVHAVSENSFVAACDMPFLNKGVIDEVCRRADGHMASVPFVDGRLQPMHAVYSKKCIKPIYEMIKNNDLRISHLLSRISIKRVEESDILSSGMVDSVDNVNTREDLARALEKFHPSSGLH